MRRKLLIGAGITLGVLVVLAIAGEIAMEIWARSYVRSAMRGGGVSRNPAEQQQTIADLTEEIGREPSDSTLYAKRASARTFAGQYDLALQDWDKASELDPTNPTNPYLKGMTCELAGRKDEAITAYQRVLTIVAAVPSDPNAKGWADAARSKLAALGASAP